MPTNDERREVARRLRYTAEHGAPEWATTACCIAECIGEDDYPLWNGSGLLFSKLADLIEPEERTCRMEPTGDGSVVCSACRTEYTSRWLHEGEYVERYCPNCGASLGRLPDLLRGWDGRSGILTREDFL